MNDLKIINWKNVFEKSSDFQNNQPFKFGFIEEFIDRELYEKLYETYPKLDEFLDGSGMTKAQLIRWWGNHDENEIVKDEEDSKLSKEWNQFYHYCHSEEFIENMRKFTGIPITKVKHFSFVAYKKGGFQLPHIHNVGPSTIVMMVYFSKNWKKGDPGGTYIASEADESKIIFEPYNLDNSVALFHDGPKAAHGTRYMTKDVERRAIQIYLEEYTSEHGWSGPGSN
jgi:hypothetical protein